MNDILRAITLWQPWASLWALQLKRFETRSWETRYRGQIAIHAAKKLFNTDCYLDRELYPFADALGLPDIYSFDKLPYGCVVATAELVGCYPMIGRISVEGKAVYAQYRKDGHIEEVTGKELLFGDWTPGRFAWEIKNVKLLPEPVPMKGAQGLWTVRDPELVLRGA